MMESKNCHYVGTYYLACKGLDDVNKSLVEEEKELSKIIKKIGLPIEEFYPKIQHKSATASEILEEWNVDDVSEAAVMSKFVTNVIDRFTKEQNAVKYLIDMKEFDTMLESLHKTELRLEMDVKYNQYLLEKFLKELNLQEEDINKPLNTELFDEETHISDNCSDLNFEEVLKLYDELKARRAENATLSKALDAYYCLPTDHAEAIKVVEAAKKELQELSIELKNMY